MREEMDKRDEDRIEKNMRESDIEMEQLPSLENPNWKREKISVMNIELDRENPRLNLPANASKKDIINALFKEAKIDNLISSILEYGRLYPGENIIVVEENNKYVVVEGNRRVCSLQCILNPQLIPIEKRDEIKKMIENSNISTSELQEIDVDISPSRDDAQKIITARHTKYQIEPWGYVTKWRRDYNAFTKYKGVEQVANHLGEDANDVKKYLKNYSFLQYVWDMPCWKSDQLEILKGNDLQGSLLEWHMRSIETMLQISFDNNYKMESQFDSKKLDYVLEKLIRSFYLDGNPKMNTRTTTQIFKSTLDQWIQEYDNINKKNSTPNSSNNPDGENTHSKNKEPESSENKSKSSITKKKGGRPEMYFSVLNKVITVNDPRLKRLTYELSKTDMKDRPATGVILARALIESALLFRIKNRNLLDKLKNENKGFDPEDIRMSKVVHFCINNVKELFSDYKKAEQSLKTIQSDHLKYMNSIVHNSWLDPSADKVSGIAGDTRELLKVILMDSP